MNFGLYFFSVKLNASAKTSLPSASVLSTSIVFPEKDNDAYRLDKQLDQKRIKIREAARADQTN